MGFVTIFAREGRLEKDKFSGEPIGLRVKEKLYGIESLVCSEKDIKFEEESVHASDMEGSSLDADLKELAMTDDDIYLTSMGKEASEALDNLSLRLQDLFIKTVREPYVVMVETPGSIVNREKGEAVASTVFIQLPLDVGRQFLQDPEEGREVTFGMQPMNLKDIIQMEKDNGV